jgi:hypothetical protein
MGDRPIKRCPSPEGGTSVSTLDALALNNDGNYLAYKLEGTTTLHDDVCVRTDIHTNHTRKS